MNGPRELSFAGCRTRDEAEARLRTWLTQVLADSQRQFETDVLTADHGRHLLDVDRLDAVLDEGQRSQRESLEDAVRSFRRLLDEHFPEG